MSDDSPWNRRKKKYTNLLLLFQPRARFAVPRFSLVGCCMRVVQDTQRTVVRRSGRVLDFGGWVGMGRSMELSRRNSTRTTRMGMYDGLLPSCSMVVVTTRDDYTYKRQDECGTRIVCNVLGSYAKSYNRHAIYPREPSPSLLSYVSIICSCSEP